MVSYIFAVNHGFAANPPEKLSSNPELQVTLIVATSAVVFPVNALTWSLEFSRPISRISASVRAKRNHSVTPGPTTHSGDSAPCIPTAQGWIQLDALIVSTARKFVLKVFKKSFCVRDKETGHFFIFCLQIQVLCSSLVMRIVQQWESSWTEKLSNYKYVI